MASEKKNGNKKTGGGSGKPGEKKGEKSRAVKEKPVYQANLLARGIGAAVCVFLAVMLGLGMFGVQDAVVVDFFVNGVKGLIGYGFWTVAPALLAAAVILIFVRQRSVQVRLWCLGFLPLIVGAFVHMLLSPYPYKMGPSAFPDLWRDGIHGFSGGVLGGMLSISFSTWFSAIGAGIFFVLIFLLLLAGIFRITPLRIVDWRRAAIERRREEEEEYDRWEEERDRKRRAAYEEEYPPELPEPEGAMPPIQPRGPEPLWPPAIFTKRTTAQKRKILGLPLDDKGAEEAQMRAIPEPEELPVVEAEPVPPPEPPREQTREEKAASVLKGAKESFFSRKTKVKRPDEVLEELNEAEDELEFDDPLPEKPLTKEEKKQAIQQEAQAVEQTVQRALEEEPPVYVYPSLDLLTEPSGDAQQAAYEELEGTLARLASVLNSFGIDGHVMGAVQGPSVTRYDISLEQGVRLNKLTNLSDDVALALGVSSVRIAPVPGKISVVGIEVPNKVVTPVPIREVLGSNEFRKHKSSAAFSVGKDIGGNYIVGDCAKLPHMLIAGTTGSGKSVCINSLIISMLYKSTPEELRLIMVDPKMVELSGYNGIPHLLIPVVTDPKKAAGALQWAVTEMMKRYRLFAEAGVRELNSYNQWAKNQNRETLPKVVIVIDELADLMLVAAKEVEESICRVAQMGRASGMHLVIATQRPSADVITGLMKANIPSRVAFAVASSLESRIILDNTGAEKLVGKGDMLWFPLGSAKPLRVQGCFISDEEVAAVVDSVKQNSSADYDDDVMDQIEQHVSESEKKGKKGASSSDGFPAGEGLEEQDELFPAAVDVILELGQASVSMLQRRLKLGYARAARLVDQMEEQGIVGPFEGSKPRQLLITKEQWQQMQNGGTGEDYLDPDPPVEDELMPFEAVPQRFEYE